MICSVSSVSGTSGIRKIGSVDGRFAHVADGADVECRSDSESAVSTTIATSGDGTAVVRRGKR